VSLAAGPVATQTRSLNPGRPGPSRGPAGPGREKPSRPGARSSIQGCQRHRSRRRSPAAGPGGALFKFRGVVDCLCFSSSSCARAPVRACVRACVCACACACVRACVFSAYHDDSDASVLRVTVLRVGRSESADPSRGPAVLADHPQPELPRPPDDVRPGTFARLRKVCCSSCNPQHCCSSSNEPRAAAAASVPLQQQQASRSPTS
jgi:hypothetical protein